MIIIAHRRNTSALLRSTPSHYGVEVDIRSMGDQMLIHHDPFVPGESFSEWIENYNHGTLILNVKEEGLEDRLVEIMRAKNIQDYFFLDQSFPFLLKWAMAGERRVAVRVSEYESVDTALALVGKVGWVWVDCFTRFPLTHHDAGLLRAAGMKLCLVSPELHGHKAEEKIPEMARTLKEHAIKVDAVCTKNGDIWEEQAKKL